VNKGYRLGPWILDNWSRAGLVFALLILCSLPLFSTADNLPLILAYTLLPVYMIHQYEEHAHGRFVPVFNATVGRGHEVLTKVSAFWINILDVWLLFLVSFYLTKYVALGFALVPVYLTLLNGVTHVVTAVALKGYNPGLYTALLLFFPWGIFLLIYFTGATQAPVLFNVIGLLSGIAGHAAIVVYAIRRRSKLESAPRRR
jgi:hypothetical protein